MKKLYRPLALLLALFCVFMPPRPAFAEGAADAAQKAVAAKRAALGLKDGDALLSALAPQAGTTAGDWTAMATAFFTDEDPEDYLESLSVRVSRAYRDEGTLSRDKATEYHRIILTCLALGADPTAFGQTPDGTAIDLVDDGVFRRENLDRQGVNGVIFALLVLGAYPFAVPENALHTEKDLVADLLSRQNPDGGWSLSGDASEPDLTAMALTALSPFLSADAPQTAAALDCLSGMQESDGGFPLYGVNNCESAAWVIIALTSLGIDPETDPRFLKNGRSVLDALLAFQSEDGVFSHLSDGSGGADGEMPMAQGLLALAALEKFRDGRRLFDFSSRTLTVVAPVAVPEEKETRPSPFSDQATRRTAVSAVLIAVVLGGLGALAGIRRKRRREGSA